jgi:hypothetical protein
MTNAPQNAVPCRALLGAAASLPLFAIGARPAGAAEFDLKFATGQSPTNPINTRLQEAIERIKAATGGRVEMRGGRLRRDTVSLWISGASADCYGVVPLAGRCAGRA